MFISCKYYYMFANESKLSIQFFSIPLLSHNLFKVSKDDNITSPLVSAFFLVSFFTLCV